MTDNTQVDKQKLAALNLILRLEQDREASLISAHVSDLRSKVTYEQNEELTLERTELLKENEQLRSDIAVLEELVHALCDERWFNRQFWEKSRKWSTLKLKAAQFKARCSDGK